MKRRRRVGWTVGLLLVLLTAGLVSRTVSLRHRSAPSRVRRVFSGSFEVWSSYEGVWEARQMKRVAAPVDGSATLIQLVPEGTRVSKGDLLARFNTADAEAERVRLEHERTRAETEIAGLRNAEIPLERLEMEAQVFEAEHALNTERQFSESLQDLVDRGLVADEETERQAARVAGLKARLDQARARLDLTAGHMHPARLARAEAALASITAQWKRVKRRIEDGTVRAPSDGVVVHIPLPLGGVFRTAQVGDTLHRNQSFLALPNMRDPVVRLQVPESDLPRVAVGLRARIRPVAFPDRVLEGTVEQVGAMAQAVPGASDRGAKGFPVRVAPDPTDNWLPAGITVQVDIRSYAREAAVQVPRSAVTWRNGKAEVLVHPPGAPARVCPVELGWAGETTIEVLDGLEPGDWVECP